jgi:DNA-binding response OmpR family regulator
MMNRILCVEDSVEYQIYLTGLLKEYTLTFAADAGKALQLTQSGRDSFDLILLDVGLPDGNGIKLLPKLREVFSDFFVPIIVLSGDNDIVTKVAAFGVGADDYIIKPTDPSELRARIEARLRAAQRLTTEKTVIEFEGLTLDVNKMCVIYHNDGNTEKIEMTPYEFKILKLLLSRPDQVYSRESIIDRVWGSDKYITSRTVDTHISHIRKKIEASKVKIETVLSTGYKLVAKDESSVKGNWSQAS